MCQVTSNPFADEQAIALTQSDFSEGGLRHISFIRPSKLLTAHQLIFQTIEGTINRGVLEGTRAQLISLILANRF